MTHACTDMHTAGSLTYTMHAPWGVKQLRVLLALVRGSGVCARGMRCMQCRQEPTLTALHVMSMPVRCRYVYVGTGQLVVCRTWEWSSRVCASVQMEMQIQMPTPPARRPVDRERLNNMYTGAGRVRVDGLILKNT